MLAFPRRQDGYKARDPARPLDQLGRAGALERQWALCTAYPLCYPHVVGLTVARQSVISPLGTDAYLDARRSSGGLGLTNRGGHATLTLKPHIEERNGCRFHLDRFDACLNGELILTVARCCP